MTIRTVTLQAFTDEESGTLGLGIKGMPRGMSAATSGLLIAHDLLEHVNGPEAIGSIDDELEALGALWFIRGQFGDLDRTRTSYYTPEQNVASDLTRMFRDSFYGAHVGAPKQSRSVDGCDADLQDIIAICSAEGLREIDDEDRREARKALPAYLRTCLYRMRLGFRKAHKACKGDGYAANRLFWAVAEAVEPYASRVDWEGQEFSLTYGTDKHGAAAARCEEAFEEAFED